MLGGPTTCSPIIPQSLRLLLPFCTNKMRSVWVQHAACYNLQVHRWPTIINLLTYSRVTAVKESTYYLSVQVEGLLLPPLDFQQWWWFSQLLCFSHRTYSRTTFLGVCKPSKCFRLHSLHRFRAAASRWQWFLREKAAIFLLCLHLGPRGIQYFWETAYISAEGTDLHPMLCLEHSAGPAHGSAFRCTPLGT